jgi:RNA polymerase subunit RPABC4/transcription elongation factor Spt4
MCGRGIGNLLVPLVAASVLMAGSAQSAPVVIAQAACPNCRTAVLPAFEWCPNCGTGLKAHACAYCGNQIVANARFCPSCGAPAGKR